MAVNWMGTPPTKCDTCEAPIVDKFYDEKTKMGPWGCLCPNCHTFGPGLGKLGLGWGQEYTKQPDGKWLKTGG